MMNEIVCKRILQIRRYISKAIDNVRDYAQER